MRMRRSAKSVICGDERRIGAGWLLLSAASVGLITAMSFWIDRAASAEREQSAREATDRMLPVVVEAQEQVAPGGEDRRLPVPTEEARGDHRSSASGRGNMPANARRAGKSKGIRANRGSTAPAVNIPRATSPPADTCDGKMALGSQELRDHDFDFPSTSAQPGKVAIPVAEPPHADSSGEPGETADAGVQRVGTVGVVTDEALMAPDLPDVRG